MRILRELLDESHLRKSLFNFMKLNGYGRARVLTSSEIDKLFAWGFTNNRDRALFGICLHTGCRISEALAVTTRDILGGYITLRKLVTKGKRRTRMIPINDPLQGLLEAYLRSYKPKSFLFPGSHNAKTHKQMTRAAADLILKDACSRLGLIGVSTHSFRRTALTQMHNAGVPLRVIQMISGHSSLETLQRYLEVTDEQIVEAVKTIGSKTSRKNEDFA
jgi:integrase/recombinase XerD